MWTRIAAHWRTRSLATRTTSTGYLPDRPCSHNEHLHFCAPAATLSAWCLWSLRHVYVNVKQVECAASCWLRRQVLSLASDMLMQDSALRVLLHPPRWLQLVAHVPLSISHIAACGGSPPCLPPHSQRMRARCADGEDPIPMPATIISSFLVEPFVETDTVQVEMVKITEAGDDSMFPAEAALARGQVELVDSPPGGGTSSDADGRVAGEVSVGVAMPHNMNSGVDVTKLRRHHISGLVEVTIGVYGTAGAMQAMQPSMQLKSGASLSFKDKFQTGGSACLTQPPPELVPAASLQVCLTHDLCVLAPALSRLRLLCEHHSELQAPVRCLCASIHPVTVHCKAQQHVRPRLCRCALLMALRASRHAYAHL